MTKNPKLDDEARAEQVRDLAEEVKKLQEAVDALLGPVDDRLVLRAAEGARGWDDPALWAPKDPTRVLDRLAQKVAQKARAGDLVDCCCYLVFLAYHAARGTGAPSAPKPKPEPPAEPPAEPELEG